MPNFDYYGKALELSELLKKEGKSEQADSLTNSIVGGCSSSEILMALRYYLSFVIKLEGISLAVQEIAVDLYNRIDKVLGRFY